MKTQCYNPKDKCYRWYGEKGIKICEEWLNNPGLFEEWALNKGYQDGLSIDRIDENEDYCPRNCRWISFAANARYKSTTRLLIVNGVEKTGRQWADELGFGTNTINTYVRTYGKENTEKFIGEFLENPKLALLRKGKQSYYELYMNNEK